MTVVSGLGSSPVLRISCSRGVHVRLKEEGRRQPLRRFSGRLREVGVYLHNHTSDTNEDLFPT